MKRAWEAAKGNPRNMPAWARRQLGTSTPKKAPAARRVSTAARAAARLESQAGRIIASAIIGMGATGAAALAGIGGVFFPREIAPGTLTPADRAADIARAGKLETIRVDAKRLPVPRATLPVPRNVTPGLEEIRVDAKRLPVPARARAPAPSLPTPATPPAARSRVQRAANRIQSAMSSPTARTAITALDLLQGRRSNSTRSQNVTPQFLTPNNSPGVGLTPTSSPQPYPFPLPQMQPPRTGSRTCECSPKKRGKQRKCLSRADVVWAGGPRKGKVAGSRCLSFARS